MKSIIMAGGKGTRLYPLTKRVPKPMVPLLDRPVMEYIVELLAEHRFDDITVTLCYLPEVIRHHFGDGRTFGVHMQYADEPMPLGTAGGVRNVASDFRDTFIIMSGDGLTDIDLSDALATHKAHGGCATLVLTQVPCPRGYGVVVMDDDNRIVRFIEKPQSWIEGVPYLVNTGIYILEPEVLKWIPNGIAFDFGRDLFPFLLQAAIPLYGYAASGYWSDIGTLEQYYQSQLDMIQGRVNVKLPGELASVSIG
jgi:NDP-sugar pyrophosphorylase family protein